MAEEVVVQEPVVVTETPEFKAALKAEREALEKTIRESNQAHLEEERRKLEALYGPVGTKDPAPKAVGKDFFAAWGEKHQLPADAGLDLAQGVIDYVERTHIAPLSTAQRRSEFRVQRQDTRAGNPRLAKLDNKYGAEVERLLASVKTLHADSYASALELVIGRHVEEVLADDREDRLAEGREVVEVKPGPMPQGAAPKPKGKIALTAHQQRRAEEMGLSEEAFVERITTRAKAMKSRGFTEESIRMQIGNDLGGLLF